MDPWMLPVWALIEKPKKHNTSVTSVNLKVIFVIVLICCKTMLINDLSVIKQGNKEAT